MISNDFDVWHPRAAAEKSPSASAENDGAAAAVATAGAAAASLNPARAGTKIPQRWKERTRNLLRLGSFFLFFSTPPPFVFPKAAASAKAAAPVIIKRPLLRLLKPRKTRPRTKHTRLAREVFFAKDEKDLNKRTVEEESEIHGALFALLSSSHS